MIPTLGSAFLILMGRSETLISSHLWERHEGLFAGVHTFAHSMLFSHLYIGIIKLCLVKKIKFEIFLLVSY